MAELYIFPVLFRLMCPLVGAALPPPFLEGVALPGARFVPAGGRYFPSLPSMIRLGVPTVRGRFACMGGVIVDFGTMNLPIPTGLRWYGLATVGFLLGFLRCP